MADMTSQDAIPQEVKQSFNLIKDSQANLFLPGQKPQEATLSPPDKTGSQHVGQVSWCIWLGGKALVCTAHLLLFCITTGKGKVAFSISTAF